MKLLHIMDSDDYENCTRLSVRHSARAILISDAKLSKDDSHYDMAYRENLILELLIGRMD